MLLISIANRLRSGIVVKIILLQSESKTALRNLQDIHLRILLISTKAVAQRYSIACYRMVELHLTQVCKCLGSLHLVENGHHRTHAFLISAHRIHSLLIKLAEFIFSSSCLIVFLQQIRKNGVDTFVIILLQLVEAAEA